MRDVKNFKRYRHKHTYLERLRLRERRAVRPDKSQNAKECENVESGRTEAVVVKSGVARQIYRPSELEMRKQYLTKSQKTTHLQSYLQYHHCPDHIALDCSL